MHSDNRENSISKGKNYLLDLSNKNDNSDELEYLIDNFLGMVVKDLSEIPKSKNKIRVYAVGDMAQLKNEEDVIFVIKEFSFNDKVLSGENFKIIGMGKVPLNIHDVAVYYREFFEGDDYFNNVQSEHEFQNLTESNKESMAFRTGIYLTKIVKEESHDKGELLHFNLLRCSSNLTGATDNFRKTDNEIVDAVNDVVQFDFEKETKLNHILAQIYYNRMKSDNSTKELKAKIKAHSDKTKDMPKEGLLVFATFYDKSNFDQLKPSKTNRFDRTYKNISGYTRMLFKLKKTVKDDALKKEFSVTLYPNSLLMIPLSTNRLYTHEIRPSVLNIDKIPIRMGYVLRCSDLEAVYMENQTYINEKGNLIKLEPMTDETMEILRDNYWKENKTEDSVEYGKVHFSMNLGDYKKPLF